LTVKYFTERVYVFLYYPSYSISGIRGKTEREEIREQTHELEDSGQQELEEDEEDGYDENEETDQNM
jgi:hypothetical protein